MRPCPSCGSIDCDGIECYTADDPDAIEFAENLKRLRQKYGSPLSITSAVHTHGFSSDEHVARDRAA